VNAAEEITLLRPVANEIGEFKLKLVTEHED